jgi:hypothetical protein
VLTVDIPAVKPVVRKPTRQTEFVYSEFEKSRLRLVDTFTRESGTSYLFRGNQPLNSSGQFTYKALQEGMKELAGIDLTKHSLVDLSIVDNNPRTTRPDLENEFAAFGASKKRTRSPPALQRLSLRVERAEPGKSFGNTVGRRHPGSIIWYPVQGCGPRDDCEYVVGKKYDFPGAVERLREQVTATPHCVVYAHCSSGHDRIGALIAGYQMNYLGRSLEDVIESRDDIALRPGSEDFRRVIRWCASTLDRERALLPRRNLLSPAHSENP